MEFNDLPLHPTLLKTAAVAGYTTPTPIQEEAIPVVLARRDVVGIAQTGTGKTAAFVLPILHRLMEQRGNRGIRALVLAPTRELAEQIRNVFDQFGRPCGMFTTAVYGGTPFGLQIRNLRRTDIVVACPGRLLDHLSQGTIRLDQLDTLVLDEADQMFDMGFLPDIKSIAERIPTERQTLLFSATMPDEIRRLASDLLRDPVELQAGGDTAAPTVEHFFYPVANKCKGAMLHALLHQIGESPVIIFAKTRERTEMLGNELADAGFPAGSLQGGLTQFQRRKTMDAFRTGRCRILVATDIAARGIDVSNISHVINFDIPMTVDAYIHRIGRTGRASKEGEAITLVTPSDGQRARAIERRLGQSVERRTLEGFDNGMAAERGHDRGGSRLRPSTGDFRPPFRQPRPRFQTAEGGTAGFAGRDSHDRAPRFRPEPTIPRHPLPHRPRPVAPAPADERYAPPSRPAAPPPQAAAPAPKPFVSKPAESARPAYKKPYEGERPAYKKPFEGDRPAYKKPYEGERPAFKKPYEGERPAFKKPFDAAKPGFKKPYVPKERDAAAAPRREDARPPRRDRFERAPDGTRPPQRQAPEQHVDAVVASHRRSFGPKGRIESDERPAPKTERPAAAPHSSKPKSSGEPFYKSVMKSGKPNS